MHEKVCREKYRLYAGTVLRGGGALAFGLAARRLSRLQRHILGCLLTQHQRTNGVIAMGHRELVQTLSQDKSNISHSLHTLAARGFIVIGRTPGGKADWLDLTAEGRKRASEIV